MKRGTKILGLTGNIGTGKSTVAWMFEELGLPVLDADAIAHEALKPHSRIWKDIYERYGSGVLAADGAIDRRSLALIIFQDPAERRFLESLIHPYVQEEIERRVAKLAHAGQPFVIVEVPLLFEAGWNKAFDAVIVVRCDEESEIRRCEEKFHLTREEIAARRAAQLPLEEKVRRADAVIDNDGPLEETRVQVMRLHHKMMRGAFPE